MVTPPVQERLAISKCVMAAPTSFECAVCKLEKPMESAVQVDGCNHPDSLVCSGCMFTEVFGNAAKCPFCRMTASELKQVTTGSRYKVTDTTLSRIHTQGGELAEPEDPDACHKCHKFGFLFVCDECDKNRCFACSGYDWPPEESDPFLCETCAEAGAATPGPQGTAGNVAMAEGGGVGGAQPATPTNEQQVAPAQQQGPRQRRAAAVESETARRQRQRVESEGDESEGDESEGDESEGDESEGDESEGDESEDDESEDGESEGGDGESHCDPTRQPEAVEAFGQGAAVGTRDECAAPERDPNVAGVDTAPTTTIATATATTAPTRPMRLESLKEAHRVALENEASAKTASADAVEAKKTADEKKKRAREAKGSRFRLASADSSVEGGGP